MSINPVNSNYYNYDYKTSIQKTNKTQNANFLLNNSYATDTVSFSSKQNTAQTTNVSELKKDLEKTKSEQGIIGKLWDGFKNITGIGAGSNKAEKAIEDFESGKISEEEMLKKVNGYKEGQKTCVDVVADIASGILAVGAFALAVPTGGASLAVGLGLATAVGAGVKIGLKAGDAAVGGREYTGKDLLYDAATGAINGLLAPVTNGLGNTVTKTIGQKFGLKIVKEGAEEVAEHAVKQGFKQGFKSVVLNQSTDVVGGSIAKRAIATGAGMAVDGALGGAGDNMVRAALNGENIVKAGIEGAVGGLIMAPIIGGGFRIAGKAGKALNGKITMSKVLPDGINTKFKQGSVGDCALLSTIDGMMNNPSTAKTLKKSITKSIGGDYNVQIGDKIVKVAKSSLTDEMLSDTTGIKIFEQAYKNLYGNLDGGFAEVVAKQFGLNPVHITNEAITDELLDTLAKNQGDSVLSFGALVDTDGAISNVNGQRHYFTIKDIDADSKMVTLTSPTDTSKSIKLSYDEVKNMGISIDGGTIKDIGLPISVRNIDDEMFRGVAVMEMPVIDETSVTAEATSLAGALRSLLQKQVDDITVDFKLSDDILKRGTDLLAKTQPKEQKIIYDLVSECFVNVKSADDIKNILLKQYVTLPHKGDMTFVLNPSNPSKLQRQIGTSNSYISQWCAEILNIPKESVIDALNIENLQRYILENRGKRLTLMVPDDFSGSGRSLVMNTVDCISKLNVPDDVYIDVVLAPATATNSSKKFFKYFANGDLKKMVSSKILSEGSETPDAEILSRFFNQKGKNINFVVSDEIYTVPTVYETSTYKNLSPSEKQIVEKILTCDSSTRRPGEPCISDLTGYGRNNIGVNGTMVTFPSDKISSETGKVIRKTPNNNLFAAMIYAVADGVDVDSIKMPGANVRELSWKKTKERVFKFFNSVN